MNDRNPYPVVKLGSQQYGLIRKFDRGKTAVVWQAQRLVTDEYYASPIAEPLVFLRTEAYEGSAEGIPPDSLVAIKVPKKNDDLPGLQEEARTLKRIVRWGRQEQWLVPLLEDHSNDPYCPCLVLGWATGQQLNDVAILSEREGLAIAYQVIQAVDEIFRLHSVPLTDSIKADSIFWNADKRLVTIIDLGLVGQAVADLGRITLPWFGDTLHRVLVGDHAGEVDVETGSLKVDPERIGRGIGDEGGRVWRRLSYSTRHIILGLLLGEWLPSLANSDKSSLEKTLEKVSQAIRDQYHNWQRDKNDLLEDARRAASASALNLYDLASSQGANLSDKDHANYQAYLHEILRGYLNQVDHAWRLPTLRWARRMFPKDNLVRRAWLVDAASRSKPSGTVVQQHWPELVQAVTFLVEADQHVEVMQFAQAIHGYEAAARLLGNPSFAKLHLWQLEALRVEASLLTALSEAQRVMAVITLDPSNALSTLDRAGEQMVRWRELAEREAITGDWQQTIADLREKAQQLKKEQEERIVQIEEALRSGRYAQAEEFLNDLENRFVYDENTRQMWQDTIKFGHELQTCLEIAVTVTERPEREIALERLLELYQNLVGIRQGTADDWVFSEARRQITALLISQAHGYARLDKYQTALYWLDKAVTYDLESLPVDTRQKWETRQKVYDTFRSDVTDKNKNTLQQAINQRFLLDDLGESLHLDLADVLAAEHCYDDAVHVTRRAFDALDNVISSLDETTWLARSEKESLDEFKRQAQRQKDKWAEVARKQRPGALRYYLRHWWQGVATNQEAALGLIGILRALEAEGKQLVGDNLPDRVSVSEQFQKLSQEALNADNVDQALVNASLACAASPDDAVLRQAFEDIRQRWFEREKTRLVEVERELDKRIVQQLYRLFNEERLEEAISALETRLSRLQEIPATEQTLDRWYTANDYADRVKRLLDDLYSHIDGAEGDKNYKRFTEACQRVRQVLYDKINELWSEVLELFVQIVEKYCLDDQATVVAQKRTRLDEWQNLLIYLKQPDRNHLQLNSENDEWNRLESTVLQSARLLKVIASLQEASNHLHRGKLEDAQTTYGQARRGSKDSLLSDHQSEIGPAMDVWPWRWIAGYLDKAAASHRITVADLRPAYLARVLANSVAYPDDLFSTQHAALVRGVLYPLCQTAYEKACRQETNLVGALSAQIQSLDPNFVLLATDVIGKPDLNQVQQALDAFLEEAWPRGESEADYLDVNLAVLEHLTAYVGKMLAFDTTQRQEVLSELTNQMLAWGTKFTQEQAEINGPPTDQAWYKVAWLAQLCPAKTDGSQPSNWVNFVEGTLSLWDKKQFATTQERARMQQKRIFRRSPDHPLLLAESVLTVNLPDWLRLKPDSLADARRIDRVHRLAFVAGLPKPTWGDRLWGEQYRQWRGALAKLLESEE